MDISLARPYDEEFRKAAFKQARFEYLDIFLVLLLTSSAAKFDPATLTRPTGFIKLGPDQPTEIDNDDHTILFLALFYEIVQVGEGRFPTVKELVDVLNYKWTCDLDWLAALVDLHNPAEV
ncbi:hypothetical protein FALBO_128 [Fusarium albosuccineum]|uniref:Uncharacterized protein n=1 Tax=Fusarium albosuccineum TaxID=1237068 RepID=A0A8H4LRP7_9HYPO|nr:hypothetical protein FALBO_128 [Fusarium albosuccineum]